MKAVTKHQNTTYTPLYLIGDQMSKYQDKNGEAVVFTRMKTAETFIKKQKEESRFIAKEVRVLTIYR